MANYWQRRKLFSLSLLLLFIFIGNTSYFSEAKQDYQPVTATKLVDIKSLVQLIQSYDNAWIDYVNKGDQRILDYIEPGSELDQQRRALKRAATRKSY